MFNSKTVKLGKLAPKKRDDIKLFGDMKAVAALPTPPPQIFWKEGVKTWPMMKNDTVGDCTCAGAGHMIQCWTAWANGPAKVLTDAQVLAAYTTITASENGGKGYDPNQTDPTTGDNPTDTGCALADVVSYWKATGFSGHKILDAVSVAPNNLAHLKWATVLFGGVYAGVQLPLSAQGQTTWSVPKTGTTGDGAPGSWGGHCIPIISFDATYFYVVSWGEIVPVSYNFMEVYFDEGYALISPDWLNKGITPLGTSLSWLESELPNVAN